jgi:hypothetical protein
MNCRGFNYVKLAYLSEDFAQIRCSLFQSRSQCSYPELFLNLFIHGFNSGQVLAVVQLCGTILKR